MDYYNQFYPTQMQPNYPTQMRPNSYPAQMNVGVMQPNQNQSGGFISVPTEDLVMSYPVEPGKCVTFKIEGKPIVMEKSMSFSQLEAPKIERYRLVKEDAVQSSYKPENNDLDIKPVYDSIDTIKSEIEALWKELEGIKNVSNKRSNNSKREKDGDD